MLLSCVRSALSLSLIASLALADTTCTTSTITIHAWPLSSATASPLAKVAEVACPSEPKTYSISSWTPPPSSSESDLVRVGHYTNGATSSDAQLENWDGVLVNAASFAAGWHKTLTLILDGEGKLSHVGFGRSGRKASEGQTGSAAEEVSVVARHPTPGASPVLNKPVVLDESGKVKVEVKDERSFLQK